MKGKPRHEPPATPASNDAEIGDHAALVARLFREHNQALVSLLTLRLHSLQDAKEIAQESYVKLLQLDRPGAASLLRAYLFRIAQNLAVDRLRKRSLQWRTAPAIEAELFDAFNTQDEPERRALAADELTFVRHCLEELPQGCREAFLLHRVNDMTVDEIAAHLGIGEHMVRYHLSRALLYCQLRIAGATPEQAKERLKT